MSSVFSHAPCHGLVTPGAPRPPRLPHRRHGSAPALSPSVEKLRCRRQPPNPCRVPAAGSLFTAAHGHCRSTPEPPFGVASTPPHGSGRLQAAHGVQDVRSSHVLAFACVAWAHVCSQALAAAAQPSWQGRCCCSCPGRRPLRRSPLCLLSQEFATLWLRLPAQFLNTIKSSANKCGGK